MLKVGLTRLLANKLEGFYNLNNRELKLVAVVQIVAETTNIHFSRVPWGGDESGAEALGFDLTGVVDKPVLHKQQTFEATFNIPALETVIIIDKERPNEIEIEVHIVGGFGPTNYKKSYTTTSTLTNLNKVFSHKPTTISVLYKEEFQISLPADLPRFGEIIPMYDQSFLTFENAAIIDGNVIWTFLASLAGFTQLKAIFNFKGRVNIIHDIVGDLFKGAQFLAVVGENNCLFGEHTVAKSSNLTVNFRVEDGLAIIRSAGYSDFGKSVLVKWRINGLGPISWPLKLSVEEAEKLLRKEGYSGNISSMQ